jgi:hypothetical protein
VLVLGALAPSRAAAQAQPSGALGAYFLVADLDLCCDEVHADLGGAVLLDVWAAFDWLRVGGFLGAGAIPSDRDASNRVLMPFGVSAAAHVPMGTRLELQVRARVGLWGGATQAEKLTLGVFVGGGAHVAVALGGGSFLTFGADVWGVIGSEAWRTPIGPDDRVSASTWVIAPGVGVSWSPEEIE